VGCRIDSPAPGFCTSFVCLAALAGCPIEEGTTWYVDAGSGSDSNDGSSGSPFQTISRGCAAAGSGDSIVVAPGTYDAALGEEFPIEVPAGVTIVGDETNRGDGVIPTLVQGGGPIGTDAFIGATFKPGTGAGIKGLKIIDDLDIMFPMCVYIDANAVDLSRCTATDTHDAVYLTSGCVNAVLVGNRIVDNSGVGLGFIGGGVGSLVEDNVITGNSVGVEYDSAGGDMGGGPAGSTGGNLIYGNSRADLWTYTSGIVIWAEDCYWDHAPPESGPDGSGIDIYNGSGAEIHTTGAQLAP
jgi:hypothetical protein